MQFRYPVKSTPAMDNPFDDATVAQRYEAWCAGVGKDADIVEKDLLGINNMNTISAQVSLYPLRQPHVRPFTTRVLEVFRARGLEIRPGAMSTDVIGDSDAVFDALKASFQSAAALGNVVMVASISNCCPLTTTESNKR